MGHVRERSAEEQASYVASVAPCVVPLLRHPQRGTGSVVTGTVAARVWTVAVASTAATNILRARGTSGASVLGSFDFATAAGGGAVACPAPASSPILAQV